MSYGRMFYGRMFYTRKPISALSSRTPASRVEGSAVVATGDKQIPPPPSRGQASGFALVRDDSFFQTRDFEQALRFDANQIEG